MNGRNLNDAVELKVNPNSGVLEKIVIKDTHLKGEVPSDGVTRDMRRG